MEEIRRNGGVGELLGHFFDEAGKAVATTVSDRALAMTREDMASRRIVAIAGGQDQGSRHQVGARRPLIQG